MASRYLRATGNWNGPVWAATSGGVAGSAATPTASDDVFINANFTVTVNIDSDCKGLYHSNGGFNLTSNKLSVVTMFQSFGSTARSINLGTGILEIGTIANNGGTLDLAAGGLTFDAASSLIIINPDTSIVGEFHSGNRLFNDVQINIGRGTSSRVFNITGSPTFHSLTIKSANSAAHTVNFEDGATILVDKFVAVGSSTANKLTIKNATGSVPASIYQTYIGSGATSYGQFVAMSGVFGDFDKAYIGSNSIDNTGTWLLQDPPKISTLVDPLTTAPGSNSNWAVMPTSSSLTPTLPTHVGGDGYRLVSKSTLLSADTFDLLDSELAFEIISLDLSDGEYEQFAIGSGLDAWGGFEDSIGYYGPGIGISFERYNDLIYVSLTRSGATAWLGGALPATGPLYIKIGLSSTTKKLSAAWSSDGLSWNESYSSPPSALSDDEVLMLRSVRFGFTGASSGSLYQDLGSINVLPSAKNTGAFLPFFIP